METKWIITGAVGLVAVVGGLIWWKVASPSDADMLKMKVEIDKKKFYDIGFKEGSAQGSTDRGKPHNPEVTLNLAEATLPKGTLATYVNDVQQSYENGVNDGYERYWTGPIPVVITTMDVPATPKDGGVKAGQSAYDYGFSRGKSRGYSDGYAVDTHDVSYYLETDGSKERQIESGNPAEYRKGYTTGYASGVAAGSAQKAFEEVKPTESSDTGFVSGVPGSRGSSVGTLLSVGYEPRTGSLLTVAGTRVLGLRPVYRAPILQSR